MLLAGVRAEEQTLLINSSIFYPAPDANECPPEFESFCG